MKTDSFRRFPGLIPLGDMKVIPNLGRILWGFRGMWVFP